MSTVNITIPEEDLLECIEADRVTIEVADKVTGRIFRREVPLHYLENHNGLMLSGENPSGESVQIAFLSDAALDKMKDLLGQGPDQPRCGHEHDKKESIV